MKIREIHSKPQLRKALLLGLCEWIDSQEALDALLPPPSGATRKMANLIKLML